MNKNAVELVQNKKSLGFFNQIFFVPKQSVETYTRPEQFESIPQAGKIQNGDTVNHQVLPPARGVGYIIDSTDGPFQKASCISTTWN